MWFHHDDGFVSQILLHIHHGCLWVYTYGEHQPSDWFSVDESGICHDFHPGLHLFGCVSAEIVCPHVWVSGLEVSIVRVILTVNEK